MNPSEQNGIVQLLSASQGIGFAVRFGNPAAEQGAYVDFTYSCALRIQGELPEQPTRISARQGLHGDGVITEVGRRSQGHDVHINQG